MVEKGITYFAYLLGLAIVVRNGAEVSRVIKSIADGANAVSSALLTGSSSRGR
jgi:hypothetical protein